MILFGPGSGRNGYIFARLWYENLRRHPPHLEGWTDFMRQNRKHTWVEIADQDEDLVARVGNMLVGSFFPLNPTPYLVLFYG